MQVIVYDGSGDVDVVKVSQRDKPVPKDYEVLVKVVAAGVNKPDSLQRQGVYPPPPGVTDIPGLEFSGHIVEKGSKVTKYEVGQSVSALVAGGAYAEFCTVHEDNILPIPKGVGLDRAAAIPENFCTVWANLFMDGDLKPHHSLLIHGGSSGIGTTALQLARLFGVKEIYVTCGTKEKCEACILLGASFAINYREEDFVKVIKEQTGGKGVDCIIDIVGGSYVQRNYECAAKNGQIIQLGALEGKAKDVDVRLIVGKSLSHRGSTLRPRSVEQKKEIIDSLVKNVWPIFDQLAVPLVSASFPYTEARLAQELLDSSRHVGKIVLTFKDS